MGFPIPVCGVDMAPFLIGTYTNHSHVISVGPYHFVMAYSLIHTVTARALDLPDGVIILHG